jgi:hypothetical protein
VTFAAFGCGEQAGDCADQIGGDHHLVGDRLRILQVCAVDDQRDGTVGGDHRGRVTGPAPSPFAVASRLGRKIRDEGLMRVEAGEVVHVGVATLPSPATRPGERTGIAVLDGKRPEAFLASEVLGAFNHDCLAPRMLAVQEVTDQSDDLVQVLLERPMAAVEEVKLSISFSLARRIGRSR